MMNSKHKLGTLLISPHTLLLSFMLCWQTPASAQTAASAPEDALPDTMLTIGKARQMQFADRALSERIISEMRRRRLASDFEIDHAEADILYNNMEFGRALAIYERLQKSPEARSSEENRMELLLSLCDTHDVMHNTTEKLECVNRLLDIAQRRGDKYYHSLAVFHLGKSLFFDGQREKGLNRVQQAIALMEQADHKNRDHQLHSQMNVLATMFIEEKRFDAALQTMGRNEALLRRTGVGGTDNLMVLLSKKASLLVKMGLTDQADSVYSEWKALPKNPDNKRTYFIIDYLRNRGLYQEAMQIYNQRLARMRLTGDTVNMMTYIMKWGMAETAYNLQRYQQAADLYLDVVVIGDTLQQQAAASKAQEIEAIYQTHRQEQQIARQHLWLLLLTVLIALLLAGALVWVRYTHIIRQKNRAMVKTIDELIRLKDLSNLAAEASAGQGAASSTDGSGAAPATLADRETLGEAAAAEACFHAFDAKVVSGRLFCNPDFDREQLIRVAGIDKNRLAVIIRQFAGTNIPGYINSKRVEYAVSQMMQHPDYTLVAIAESSGFTSQTTFIRAFRNVFGITPSEYRQGRILPPPLMISD